MKVINFGYNVFIGGICALIGGTIGYFLENPLPITVRWKQLTILGGVIGFLILPIYSWLTSGRRIVLDSIEIPLFTAKVKVSFSEAHRLVGWKIFVETATRISSQSLNQRDGSLTEALASLYKLFDTIRTELKSQFPSASLVQDEDYTIESYALRMLNDALRPMLTRWHPRLSSCEKKGISESEWLLADLCRKDLEATRQRILVYAYGLGKILGIHNLDKLLPQIAEGQTKPKLVLEEELIERESQLNLLDDSHRAGGWRIFVELSSRVATQPLKNNTGVIREALNSLNSLYEIIRNELKQLNPQSIKINNQTSGSKNNSVEKISLSILNGELRDFLSKWHPALLKLEKENKPEPEWSEAENCRAELKNLQLSLFESTKKLGELINIRVDDYI